MNKLQLTVAGIAALTSSAFAQTITNGNFENSTLGSTGVKYGSEIADGQAYGGSTITSWKTDGSTSIFQYNNAEKKAENALLIAGAEVDGTNSAATQLEITVAGKYSITFDTFKEAGSKDISTLGIVLSNKEGSEQYFKNEYTEALDNAITKRSFDFEITEKILSDSKGAFRLTLQNGGDKEARGDMLVDNVSIQAAPEPSSMALLGLGGIALILRRRK